jgi:hypothetical protein
MIKPVPNASQYNKASLKEIGITPFEATEPHT